MFCEYAKLTKHERKQSGLDIRGISERLNLGFSTVMHKKREFEKTGSIEGVLLQCKDHKRQYKKTGIIQNYIWHALDTYTFRSAMGVSNFIHHKWGVRYSRSTVSRHLMDMGCYHSHNGYQMPEEILVDGLDEKRETFVRMLTGFHIDPDCCIYVGDTTFEVSQEKFSVMIAANCQEILHFSIQPEEATPRVFYDAVKGIGKALVKKRTKDTAWKQYIILTEVKPAYC